MSAEPGAVRALEPRYQGQGRLRMRELFKKWIDDVNAAWQSGGPIVHMYCGANIAELFRSFGFQVLYGEITALQTAAKKQSLKYIAVAEEIGYSSPDICGYHEIEIGRMVANLDHPLGHIPPPTLVMISNSCVPYIKWGEFMSRHYGVPMFTIDVPYLPKTGYLYNLDDAEYQAQRRYVTKQLEELVALCERLTGRKFDIDKLIEHEHYSNRMADLWSQILNMNKEKPAVFDCWLDGLSYLGVWNAFRATKEGVEYLEAVLQELKERRELGITPIPQERFRLLIDGVACWPYLRRWVELFHHKWGAVFVWGHYLNFAGGGMERGFRHDTSRPLESLADYLLGCNTGLAGVTHIFGYHEWPKLVAEYQADGIVFHSNKSCRICSAWMPDMRERLTEQGFPTLILESDIVDPRYFSEAQLRNRVDAFLEALERKKLLEQKEG